MKFPKVLITSVTSDRHDYVQQLCFGTIKMFDYPNFDFKIIEISKNKKNFDFLKSKDYSVIRGEWKPEGMERLVGARNIQRKLTLEGDYDYMLNVDADTILPKWALNKLVSHNKDCVGFVVPVGWQRISIPCVFKSGKIIYDSCRIALDFYDWPEIFRLQPALIKVHGSAYGLIHRRVLEQVPFRFTRDFPVGEDVLFYNEIGDKGFEFWCDTSIIASHYRSSWAPRIYKLSKLGKIQQKIFFKGR